VADLTNRSVASSYKELLKTASGDGLTSTLTVVEDGDATPSSLQLATNAARLTGTLQVDGVTTLANPSESTTKDNGSLVVEGGVGIEKNLNVGGNLEVTGNAVIQGTLTANGGTLTLGDANTDNVVFQADVNSDIRPNVNDAYSLGSPTLQWRDLYVDSTAFIDNVQIHDSALITPGGPVTISPSTGAGTLVINPAGVSSMNNVTIGAATPRDGTFSNLTALTSQVISATTPSTNKDTGALVVEGGVGIEQNLNVGGDFGLTGNAAVNGGNLTTSSATFNLVNANATTLNVGGAATTVELGAASGTTNVNNNLVVDLDLQVKGGDLTTDQTTFNLLNSTATTVNFAGAATTLELGSATGTTSINHDLTVDGNTTLGNANTDTVTFTARAASNFVPSTDDSRDLGASTLEWKDLFIDGTANIDSLVADTADINGGTIDGVTIGTNAVATDLRVDNLRLDANTVSSTDTNGNIVLDPNGTGIVSVAKALTVTGNLTANANTTLGDANTDTVTFTARAASSLVPATDNSHDLGASALEWKDLFIDGTAKVDTLTVDENATVAGNLTVTGDLTVNGTTTNINTANLVVEDKNVILGDVAAPTDITADGGGITLKGATDKTINWVDATDAWTSSEHLNLANTKEYRVNGSSVLSATTLGSGVTASSLTSTGTVTSGTWSSTILTDDSAFTLRDNADSTKRVQFQVSGVTAGQTRTLTVADANQTLVGFTGTSADSWNWDTDFDHITVVIPGVGTRKIPYYA